MVEKKDVGQIKIMQQFEYFIHLIFVRYVLLDLWASDFNTIVILNSGRVWIDFELLNDKRLAIQR